MHTKSGALRFDRRSLHMQQVKTESARIRERLSHPVIDGDGHTVEFLPVVLDYMRDLGGSKTRRRVYGPCPCIYTSILSRRR